MDNNINDSEIEHNEQTKYPLKMNEEDKNIVDDILDRQFNSFKQKNIYR